MNTRIQGELEIDHTRGVIYFHSKGGTVLRICRLPKPIPQVGELLDITYLYGVSWEGKQFTAKS